MNFWDHFYAGERNYSVAFIVTAALVSLILGLPTLYFLGWAVAETIEHFMP